MIRIAGRRSHMLLKAVLDTVEHAVVLGLGLFLFIDLRHLQPYFGIRNAIWVPSVASAVGTLLGIALSDRLGPLEVEWDQAGLTIRVGETPTHVAWSEYQGYRYMWEYPAGLKIRRVGKRALKLDVFAFPPEERSLLLAELTARHVALPNKRLKLTARVELRNESLLSAPQLKRDPLGRDHEFDSRPNSLERCLWRSHESLRPVASPPQQTCAYAAACACSAVA